ncbi:MAG: hypothetical protein H7061_13680 [Bdellovibrionaceae bacterium]|nr:hypothetical protein [Bdellovibrio sp.]
MKYSFRFLGFLGLTLITSMAAAEPIQLGNHISCEGQIFDANQTLLSKQPSLHQSHFIRTGGCDGYEAAFNCKFNIHTRLPYLVSNLYIETSSTSEIDLRSVQFNNGQITILSDGSRFIGFEFNQIEGTHVPNELDFRKLQNGSEFTKISVLSDPFIAIMTAKADAKRIYPKADYIKLNCHFDRSKSGIPAGRYEGVTFANSDKKSIHPFVGYGFFEAEAKSDSLKQCKTKTDSCFYSGATFNAFQDLNDKP